MPNGIRETLIEMMTFELSSLPDRGEVGECISSVSYHV